VLWSGVPSTLFGSSFPDPEPINVASVNTDKIAAEDIDPEIMHQGTNPQLSNVLFAGPAWM
jgi:hypothetical protein